MLSKIKDNNSNKIKIGDLYDKKDIFLQKYNENSDIDLIFAFHGRTQPYDAL